MFDKVTIIGFGLIGSSLARNIKKHNLAKKLVCVDRDKDVCKKVIELDLADEVMSDVRKGVTDADLIILAVPVGACGAVAEQMRYSLKEGAIITDVGSVKSAVVDAIAPHVSDRKVHIVPAHPIAGTEFSGPEAGFAELFEGRWCVITPLPDSDVRAVEKVVKLWEACGSTTEIMDPKRHDLILAITSHLPHLIAYTIVDTANDLEKDTKDEVIKFSASGFRDFTRIASSDPVMWRDVFLSNRDAVLEILQRFTEDLTAMQKAIRRGEGDYLEETFRRTRAIRKQVIEAGQARYATPTGSREDMPVVGGRHKASGSQG